MYLSASMCVSSGAFKQQLDAAGLAIPGAFVVPAPLPATSLPEVILSASTCRDQTTRVLVVVCVVLGAREVCVVWRCVLCGLYMS